MPPPTYKTMTKHRKEIIGDATLYLGDCLEVMQEFEAGSIDAVVTDPPYYKVLGEQWDREWGSASGFLGWMCEGFKCWRRLLADNGSLYVFAYPHMAARVEVSLQEYFKVLNHIVWKKPGGRFVGADKKALRAYFPQTERIIFAEQYGVDCKAMAESQYDHKSDALRKKVYSPLGKYFRIARIESGLSYQEIAKHISRDPALYLRWEEGVCLPNPSDYAKCQMILPSLRKEYEELCKEYEELRRPFAISEYGGHTDVWDYAVVQGYLGKHPAEKPEQLMAHMIDTSTKPAQTILDPFMGSGTTGVACVNMGRKFIGIELEEKYFDIACRRIELAQAQGKLPFDVLETEQMYLLKE